MMTDSQLPLGWEWATLSELSKYVTSGARDWSQYYSDSGVLFVRTQDINTNRVVFTDMARMKLPEGSNLNRTRIEKGDLLYTVTGANVGKCAVVDTDIEEAYPSQSVALVKLIDTSISRFLHFASTAETVGQKQLEKMAYGMGRPVLNLDNIRELRFPIAPLAEQRRIVARIEELFAELDAAVEELERVRANLKRYRASVLKAAVLGDLTADWRAKHPTAEPASVLLDRILTDRRAKWEADQLAKFAADKKTPPKHWQAKYAEPSKPDTSKLPTLPDGWTWASVEQLTEMSEYGTSTKCDYQGRGQAVLRIPNIAAGEIDISDLKYATEPLPLTKGEELLPGDLLVCRTNGSVNLIGKAAVVKMDFDQPFSFASYLLRFRFAEAKLSPFWLHLYMSSTHGRRFIEGNAASSAGQHNISLSVIHRMPVPLPPLAEQEAIVLEVEARLSDVTAAEAIVNANLTRAARLRQSILKEAFAGRLVPQDPADEPAAMLLERIRTATPTASPAKPPRGRKATAEVNEAVVDVLAFAVPTATEAGPLNRTKLQKFAAVLQTHHGVEIVARFLQAPYGPYAREISEMEPVCAERGYFRTKEEPKGEDGFEVAYVPSENAEAGRSAGVKRLGENTANAEKLLRLIRSMTTDEAELFATVYAVWNDSLLDGKPVDDAAIAAGVYAWNVQKRKFTPAAITSVIARIRTEGYEPTGRGCHTEPTKPKRGRIKATTSE